MSTTRQPFVIVARARLPAVALLMLGMLLAACGGTARPTLTPAGGATPVAGAPKPAMATPGVTTAPATAPQAIGTPRIQGAVTVFAAASLTDAFKEIGVAIERADPGTKVAFNFAGSPALRAQLREGARADLFAAADEPTMQGAQRDGTIAGEPRHFVQNKLVVIVPAQNPAAIARLPDLAKPGIKLVLAQEAVPVGTYARQAFAKMSDDAAFGNDFSTRALANVVSQEANVRQVVTKVRLGEADAGIVYSSDVTPTVRPQVKVIEIPDAFNVIARYPIAIVKDAANEAGARAFIAHLLSPAGQGVLARHGFIPVGPAVTTTAGRSGDGLTLGASAVGRDRRG